MSPDERVAVSRRLLEECFNDGNLGLVDEFVAGDAVDHDPATPPHLRSLRGPAHYKAVVSMYRAAFPDVHMTVEDAFAADDKVVLRWRSEGTHRGELDGFDATGAPVAVTGISIDRWADDKLVESWGEWDNLGLARQIGAAPPEGSRGDRFGRRLQHLNARRMRRRTHA
jgi:predicted ester cyclase